MNNLKRKLVNTNPLISIIVPNYNHEKYLKKRIESILNQTYSNIEIILLDDFSIDNSRKILLKYADNPKVSNCVFNEVNSGNTFIQWNKGISLAKGEYIWIAESDDFCESNFLEEVLEPMIVNKDVVISYCQSNRVNENGIVTGTWLNHTNDLDNQFFLNSFILKGNNFIERFLIHKNVIPNASAVLFKKKSLDKLRVIDIYSKLRYCGDWVIYFQLVANNKISYNPKLLNNFRYHSESVIGTAKKNESRLEIIGIDFVMRKEVMNFLLLQNLPNFKEIKEVNRQVIKGLNFERAVFFIKNNNKIKGFIILSTVLDVFFKSNQLRKYLKKIFFKLNITIK